MDVELGDDSSAPALVGGRHAAARWNERRGGARLVAHTSVAVCISRYGRFVIGQTGKAQRLGKEIDA